MEFLFERTVIAWRSRLFPTAGLRKLVVTRRLAA
jgi:hypothetical protein